MMDEYENYLLGSSRGDGTVKLRLRHVRELRRVHADLLGVGTSDLERILARKRHLAPETVKSLVSSWRVFYGWAHDRGLIERDPAAALEPIVVPVRVPRLAPDDVVQLALITATLEQQAMILLARHACLRLTELTTLPMANRDHDRLRIRGKGNRERYVYMHDSLLHVLSKLERELGRGGYYFPGRFGGHLHPQSVNKIITRVTGCNPHSLRHAGATAAYNSTHDLRGVQMMLGHSSLATTQRYLHLDEDRQRKVAAGTSFRGTAESPHFVQFAA